MNKMLNILVLAFAALNILCSCSFGVVIINKAAIITARPSLEPSGTQTFAIGDKHVKFDTYLNKDIKGYNYSIKIPSGWHIKAGKRAGSFVVKFAGGSCSSTLTKVPGIRNLEAYILGQEEPDLEQKLSVYRHINFEKGYGVYRLTYTFYSDGDGYWEARTYYEKGDRFCLMTLTVLQSDLNDMLKLFDAVVNSFRWEND